MNWKRCLNKLFVLPVPLLLLLVLLSGWLLYEVFAVIGTDNLMSYLVYVLSFYTLVVVCIRAIPATIHFWRRQKTENPYLVRYLADVRLRIRISLTGGLCTSMAYAAFQLGLGMYHASIWFYAMAVYYLLLAVMRFFLLRYVRRCESGHDMAAEVYWYRFCGYCLLLMQLVLSVIISYCIWRGYTFRHHEITMITMATYTFAAFATAITNLIRYRKYKSPVYVAAKSISLAAASVSMLTLTAAMLAVFGTANDVMMHRVITGATGTVVSLLIFGMAVYMIWNAKHNLKQYDVRDTTFNKARNDNEKPTQQPSD